MLNKTYHAITAMVLWGTCFPLTFHSFLNFPTFLSVSTGHFLTCWIITIILCWIITIMAVLNAQKPCDKSDFLSNMCDNVDNDNVTIVGSWQHTTATTIFSFSFTSLFFPAITSGRPGPVQRMSTKEGASGNVGTRLFIDRMPFTSSDQQWQRTEGITAHKTVY